jgi:class 3 adenylate cyclase/ketosteroid isomerase-like protein/predicted ester cyclase
MSSSVCAGCGHANVDGARFCAQCGNGLTPRCAACGAELQSEAHFCSNCGAAVAAAPALVGEDGALKVVSVVFSDLVGSTALQEALDAESVRRVMTRFYDAMRAVVKRHDGAIQKFIGDAVVVVFGAPVGREDDALRAVRCAAAMVGELARLNDELEPVWGVRLQVRTGVNTGELVVNQEGIFVGDTMNTAARLEQAAGAGEVMVGEGTWRLVRHKVELEELAPLDLKGKSQPVRVWRLVSAEPGLIGALARAEVPLVGRRSELERLGAAFAGAQATCSCRLVTVIGSPGLGKSRLAREFADTLGDDVTVLVGHCEPSGEGVTFLPIAEVMRDAAAIGEADAADIVAAKLSALVSDDPDCERIVARTAALLGAGESASPEETFWSVRRLLESLAHRGPLVVVLDDVHWAQPMLLDLVEHLIEWVRGVPILILALARPELREAREALTAAGRRASDVIELEPLAPAESRQLVEGVLGGPVELPAQLLERILHRTEGNPLFLGELLRMLIDDGSLTREGEMWTAVGGEDAVQVPPTIQALLTARIERLRPDERAVVERASVIGKQFYRGAVAELVAPPVRLDIDGHLETLRRKDMVEPEGTYWIDEPVYRFHHVLIRDAAYHLLLKEARAELHEKFADWLQLKAGELVGEHEEVIAYHLEQAHEYRRQLGPLDERGRALGARAAALLTSTGRRALAREDLAAAANLLSRALGRGGDEAAVLWDLAEAQLSAGDTSAAAVTVDRLRDLTTEGVQARAEVLSVQLEILTGTGEPADALARATEATAELAAAGEHAGEAKGHHVLAQARAQLGQVAAVEAELDHALLAARRADDRRRITAVLAAAPRAALWGPSPVVRASGRCLDVVRILRMTPGNGHVEAVALRCQAVLEAMRGRPEAAREILDAGRTTLEELGLTLELHELALHAGIVELLAVDAGAAETLLRGAREGFASLGVAVGAAQAAALLARALVEQGRDSEAIAETEFAEEWAGGDLKTTITWCGVRAEALARRGSVNEALAVARRAVALAEPTDALADKADADMALARVLFAAGRIDEARRTAWAAHDLYTAKDHAVGAREAGELAAGIDGAVGPPAPAPREVDAAGDGEIGDPGLAAFYARYSDAWAAGDVDSLLRLYDPEWVLIDHRQVGWGELRGSEALEGLIRSSIDALAAGLRFHIDEVLDCAPGAVAMRVTWRGRSTETGGEIEFQWGHVGVVRSGRLLREELFDLEAEISIRACFAELRGQLLLGEQPPARLMALHADRFGRRDGAGFADDWAPDGVLVDHRALAWEETWGRDALVELAASAWQMWPDIRWGMEEVLACDERVIAYRGRYLGSGADWASPMEIPVGYVTVVEDGRIQRQEQFDYDDAAEMLARYVELGGYREVVLGKPPERFFAEWCARWAARDVDAILDLYAEDFRSVDHRQVGWEEASGRDETRSVVESVLATDPAARVRVDQVLACDERAIALTVTWFGTLVEGGGDYEAPLGYVALIEGGRMVRQDRYEADDRTAMLARHRELHGLGLLGQREPERWFARFVQEYASHHEAGLGALWAETAEFIDRRAMAWEPLIGRDAIRELARSAWAIAPDSRCAVDEVLACDERVIAARLTYVGTAADGGGPMEVAVGYVNVVEDGVCVHCDQFDHDDREAMLARYAELVGHVADDAGGRAPERFWAEFCRRLGVGDLDALMEMYADDHVMVDHRQLGWEQVDKHGTRRLLESFGIGHTERHFCVGEVLACDDRVCAVTVTAAGVADTDQGGGEWEIAYGIVAVIEDGRLGEAHQYEREDRQAMVARYAELGGGQGPLGDRPPERYWARKLRRFAARDLDAIESLYSPDWVFIDHRGLGWEEIRGHDGAREYFRGVYATSPDVYGEIDEVVACDERVVAVRTSWRGTGGSDAGAFVIQVGFVDVVEDGRSVRREAFEYEDTEAMIVRSGELGGRAQAVRTERAPERWCAELTARVAARDLESVLDLYGDDHAMIDHRALGWEQIGKDGVRRLISSWIETMPDVRWEAREVLACDDRVIAAISAIGGTAQTGDGGGPGEVYYGWAGVIEEGRLRRAHLYDVSDRQAIIDCYAELGGGQGPLGDRPPERFWAELLRAYARSDLDALVALYDENVVSVDHRELGWDEMRWENIGDFWRSALATSTEQHAEIDEVLACDDRVIALRLTFHAVSADTGGVFAVPLGNVCVIEDGRWVRQERYDHDDTEAMLARYAELGGRIPEPDLLGDRPPERVMARRVAAWNARDRAALADTYAREATLVDHRQLGWEVAEGRDALVELAVSSWAGLSADQQLTVEEVLACDERVIAVRVLYRGTALDGGGAVELAMGQVVAVRDDRIVSGDQYDSDDRDGMLARFAELSGARSEAAAQRRAPERFWAEYERRFAAADLDWILELYADGHVMVDHRRIGWEEIDMAGLRKLGESVFAMGTQMRFNVDEVLACDERFSALIVTVSGTSTLTGGAFAFSYGIVADVRDGKLSRADQYDADHREAMMARYSELVESALDAGRGELRPQRSLVRYLDLVAARDIDGMRAALADDVVVSDHRALGGPPARGPDAAVAFAQAALGVTSELRYKIVEVLAGDERAVACRGEWRGKALEGEGEVIVPMALVASITSGGLIATQDLFEAEDEAAIRACFESAARS